MVNQVDIDPALCVGCRNCEKICPQRAITFQDQKPYYDPSGCFLCGHCYAVCPSSAIRVDGLQHDAHSLSYDQSRSYPQKSIDLVTLMSTRRSCRLYTEEEVALPVLEDLVKIGITAPSGTNSQGWNFTVLPTREDVLHLGEAVAGFYRKLNRQAENGFLRAVVKLFGGDSLGNYYRNYYETVQSALQQWDTDGTDLLFHGATSVFLVSGKKGCSCPSEDALLATQNILLAAHSMGLGTCLIGFVVEAMRRDTSLIRKMEIPEDEEVYSVIAIGVPAVQFLRPAGRKQIQPRIFKRR